MKTVIDKTVIDEIVIDETARDWGCVNVRFLWKHRHVHPMIRERLRWWIDYARGGDARA